MFGLNIKSTLSLLLAGLFSSAASGQDSTLKVLFIGNSYTHMYDLPGTTALCASSINGTKFNLITDQSTPGGHYWYRHAADTNTIKKIKTGAYDAIVLQEQSQMLSLQDSVIASQSLPYLQFLVDTIKKYQPKAQLYFYRTWGRKNGDKQNASAWPVVSTYEGMDSLLNKRYTQLSDSLNAKLVRVGDVWKAIRKQYPELELYDADESHPSPLGTYAAAVTFASTLFGIHPLDMTYRGKLSEKEALQVRMVAEQVLYPNNATLKGANIKSKKKKKKLSTPIEEKEELYLGQQHKTPRLKKEDIPFNSHPGGASYDASVALLSGNNSNVRRRKSKQ